MCIESLSLMSAAWAHLICCCLMRHRFFAASGHHVRRLLAPGHRICKERLRTIAERTTRLATVRTRGAMQIFIGLCPLRRAVCQFALVPYDLEGKGSLVEQLARDLKKGQRQGRASEPF